MIARCRYQWEGVECALTVQQRDWLCEKCGHNPKCAERRAAKVEKAIRAAEALAEKEREEELERLGQLLKMSGVTFTRQVIKPCQITDWSPAKSVVEWIPVGAKIEYRKDKKWECQY